MLNPTATMADLTGPACTQNTIHWTCATWMPASSTRGDTWFLIAAGYAFGHAPEKETSDVIEAAGGGLGSLRAST